jgi:hypothetical protein
MLLLCAAETLLGRCVNWPIFEVVERQGTPVALQVTSDTCVGRSINGWSTYLIEDHVNFA